MSTSEPEAWSFSEDKFKKYESENSSSEDSSDDEQLFSKTKTIKIKSKDPAKTRYALNTKASLYKVSSEDSKNSSLKSLTTIE